MNFSQCDQILVNQGNHSAGNAIPLGRNVLSYTVYCLPQSGSNAYVGINTEAGPGFLLEPSDSYSHKTKDGYYSKDVLYISFDSSTTGGTVLVIVEKDTGVEAC
jgi:hypothetical protein